MATEKKITSRIQQKHDVAANWAKATNFIPKKGEIIIYDAEYNTSGEETQAVRFKIGDGSKTVNNLPFVVIDYSSDIETLKQKVANNSTAIGALQENTVPKTRKINNKALSSDITLGAADVGVNETTFPGLKKTGTVTGVRMNGTTQNPSSGVVDLGTVITAHQSLDGKQDKLNDAQLTAVNSGITSGKVSTYDGYAALINGKQDKITSSNKLSSSLVDGLGAAAAKAVDTAITANSTSTNLPTSKAVEDRINAHSGIDKVGTITGIKMNSVSKGTSGVVDLGTVLTDASKFATAAQGSNADSALTKANANATEISNIKNGTTKVKSAEHADTADSATSAGTATKATEAMNVTENIKGHAIADIFETNGTTVKKATSAGTADKVANGLTLGGGVVYDGSKALSITAGNKMSITGGPGGVSIGLAHSVMPSTYNKVTVDGYGTVTAGENVDYLTSHQSIKKLNTNNTTAQTVNASEAIAGSGTINLHKVAKTGSYNDLSNKPTFVSSVNGSSGAITNVAKTDETNTFTSSQILSRLSDETQASLWNYSGCIAYSHWVQGSSSEPRIGIGYKNSGIRVFNGTTETPAQYYDVTMPSQAGQLVTDTFAKFTGETSGIGHPYRVFQDEAAYATYQSGDPFSVKYTSQTNAALIINTDANNRTAFVDGRIDNKKNGTKYELTLPTKTGTLALTSDISGKLDKTTYEVNKTIAFGRDGALYIGKFKVYDTNVTFEVTSTTSVTYSGKLVIATQNYVIKEAKVYGDAANTVAPNIYIKPSTTSDPYIEVYFKPESWSKNVVHIYGCRIEAEPTDVCTNVPAVPSTATLKPKNALDSKANASDVPTFSLSGTTLTITM